MSTPPAPSTPPDILSLFPIPGLILFPGIVQGLHVFEPRYRALTQDVLAHNLPFALALPLEAEEDHPPTLAEVACAVKVLKHERLEDGKFNLSVLGTSRVRIEEEVEGRAGYRRARVVWIKEQVVDPFLPQTTRIRRRLVEMFRNLLLQASSESGSLSEDLEAALPLHLLTNLIAYVVPLPTPWKLELLRESNPLRRAEMLIEMRSQLTPGSSTPEAESMFPPDFSVN